MKTFPDKDLPCSPRPGPPTGKTAPPWHPPTFEASNNPDGAPAWWSEPHHVVLEARLLSRLHSAAALQQVHASVLSPIHSDPPNPKHNGHRQGLLRCHRRRRPRRQGHHGGKCPSSRWRSRTSKVQMEPASRCSCDRQTTWRLKSWNSKDKKCSLLRSVSFIKGKWGEMDLTLSLSGSLCVHWLWSIEFGLLWH